MTFGGYCILFKTPLRMKSVKWLLAILHFWSTVSDLVLSFLGVPYLILPAIGGFFLGVLDNPALVCYAEMSSLAGESLDKTLIALIILPALSVSIINIYESRYYKLFGRNSFWRKIRSPFLFILWTSTPLFFLPQCFYIPNQEVARQKVLEMLPCLSESRINDRNLFVLSIDSQFPHICLFTGATFYSILVAIFMFLTVWKLWFGKKIIMSKHTIKLQKSLSIAIIIQVMLPKFQSSSCFRPPAFSSQSFSRQL